MNNAQKRNRLMGGIVVWGALYAFLFTSLSMYLEVPITCVSIFSVVGALCGIVVAMIVNPERLGFLQTRLLIGGTALGGFFGVYFGWCGLGS